MQRSGIELLECLQFINPADLTYQEWLEVGMGLKESGYPVTVWDEWSQNDSRYHRGECYAKWGSFNGSGKPVTGGTIVMMAKERGWRGRLENASEEGYPLDWGDCIGTSKEDGVVIDKEWLEQLDVIEPVSWRPEEHLIRYLETLFDADDLVGYVTEVWEKDGKYLPTKGVSGRTAGELIALLSKCNGDIGSVIGDVKEEAGAWIRFNPLDGKGVKNENVTEFRFALVESDRMELGQQNAMIRELELPVACLVYSGGKSLHAIVRVDAGNYDEYRKRVEYLYSVLQKNGFEVDGQNKNPSRLSRMPGVIRNGHKQFLLDTNIGKSSWNEWVEWIESINDDLPDMQELDSALQNLPALSPPLIDGVLRQGHKMLLAGPSKAGKSFALIELTIAIAEGQRWFGWPCAQGRVLYVNLELDTASCLNRFRDVYDALGWKPEHAGNIDVWNLRGRACPMDKLAPKLIRRAAKKNYIAIIIDPIYKVITGDENSADQMAAFCNQFDRVCTELGAAVIYCHHHSKGSQGQKRSMDRASGSGVFARDPDAMLDLIELELTDAAKRAAGDRAFCDALTEALDGSARNWRDTVGQDEMLSPVRLREAAERLMTSSLLAGTMAAANAARASAEARTAWRIEGTLREFPKFKPLSLWFQYPVHLPDENGVLDDLDPEGEPSSWQKNFSKSRKRQGSAEDRKKERQASVETAFYAVAEGGIASVNELAEYMGVTEKTVTSRLKEHGRFTVKAGAVILSQEKK